MKVKITMIMLSLWICFSCGNNPASTDPPDGNLSVIDSNIAESDSVFRSAGIWIRFDDQLDVLSFDVKEIVDYTVFYGDANPDENPQTDTTFLSVINIIESDNVLLNGKPQSLWYDPASRSIALIQNTTVAQINGTGEGLVLSDVNVLRLKSGLKSESGHSLKEDYVITFYAKSSYGFGVVPNPFYPLPIGMDNRFTFFNLPSSCVLNVYNINHELVYSKNRLNETLSGTEKWILNDQTLSGIYHFEIVSDDVHFEEGVMVINR